MVLTAANLFHYLHGRSLAASESVVDGTFRVLLLSRRNQVFKASAGSETQYILKQVKDWHDGNVRTFESEVHWYWLAENQPGFAPLAPFLSKCSSYDAENQILVFEPPRDAEDLDRFYRRTGAFSEAIARLTGETLASFHIALSAEHIEQFRGEFVHRLPWICTAHRLEDNQEDNQSDSRSGGVKELVEILREYPQLGDALEELRQRWLPSTLINGDMKWAHCILKDQNRRMYFIDWEMAGYGDPCWDAGAILQEYLLAWLRSIPASREAPIEELLQEAGVPLSDLHPSIRTFWQSYIAGMRVDRAEASAMLVRALRYAAAWLIQTAFQGLRESEHITARTVRMAQLSHNMLLAPVEATQGLLGL